MKVSRVPDIDEFLDPKSLTPQELYTLQSDTWADGVEHERERIIKLLEGFDDSCLWRQVEWSPDAYEGFNMQELIELIKGERK